MILSPSKKNQMLLSSTSHPKLKKERISILILDTLGFKLLNKCEFFLFAMVTCKSEKKITVKPKILRKDDLRTVRVKVGTPFSIPVEFLGEPNPKATWIRKTLVGGV